MKESTGLDESKILRLIILNNMDIKYRKSNDYIKFQR
jgi:hypothetical protein